MKDVLSEVITITPLGLSELGEKCIATCMCSLHLFKFIDTISGWHTHS